MYVLPSEIRTFESEENDTAFYLKLGIFFK